MPNYGGPQLGAQVRRLRTERGWTQEELARYSGVSRPTIARLETGAVVTTKTLQVLCRALDAQALLHRVAS
ncbi:MAG: helix-turn-helix domain-containing protein [Corynebacterium glucuronolyticum]|nr:helix-turn-helix domain-containing protein [Corynebacterium glucuronolyticum]